MGETNSKARANIMPHAGFRALFNVWISDWRWFNRLSLSISEISFPYRGWFRVDRKQTVIKPHQLAGGIKASYNCWRRLTAMLCYGANYFYLLFVCWTRKGRYDRFGGILILKAKTITLQDTKSRGSSYFAEYTILFMIFLSRSQQKTRVYFRLMVKRVVICLGLKKAVLK